MDVNKYKSNISKALTSSKRILIENYQYFLYKHIIRSHFVSENILFINRIDNMSAYNSKAVTDIFKKDSITIVANYIDKNKVVGIEFFDTIITINNELITNTHTSTPINNHTCNVCGNTKCNKMEKSCWKCGSII